MPIVLGKGMPYVISAFDTNDVPSGNVSYATIPNQDDVNDVFFNGNNLSVDNVLDVLFYEIKPVFVTGRLIHFLWYAIGFVGNLISAFLWLQPHLYDVCSSAHYLFAIAICDIICQALHVFYYLRVFWRVQAFDNIALCKFWSLVYMVPQYVGQLLVLGYTIDKNFSINKPFSGGSFASQNRSSKIIVWIVITVTTMVFPQAYFWEGIFCDVVRSTDYHIWNWLTLSIVYIITPAITLFLNLRILHVYRHPERYLHILGHKQEFANHLYGKFRDSLRESVYILVTLSFFRVFSLLPDTIMRCFIQLDYFQVGKLPALDAVEDVESNDEWMSYVIFTAVRLSIGFLSYSYLACSVIVYCWASPTFRNDLRTRLRRIKAVVTTFVRTKYTLVREYIESLREEDN